MKRIKKLEKKKEKNITFKKQKYNKNLYLFYTTIILIILLLFSSLLFNKIIVQKVYYDKLIKIDNNKYEFGILTLKNNFIMPQTISLKEEYYCIKYYSINEKYKKNYTDYSEAIIEYESNVKITKKSPYYYDYNNYLYVTLKPKQKTDIKIILNLNDLKQKNFYDPYIKKEFLEFYIIKPKQKSYFNCNYLNNDYSYNDYTIIKKYDLKNLT